MHFSNLFTDEDAQVNVIKNEELVLCATDFIISWVVGSFWIVTTAITRLAFRYRATSRLAFR